jgi:hypothetical protein
MKPPVTILTFSDPVEVAILRGRMEAEGIPCFVQDELTAQLAFFVSDAIGGIKLQVREEDVERAVAFLHQQGYIEEEDFLPSPLEMKLYRFFSRIPFLRRIYK